MSSTYPRPAFDGPAYGPGDARPFGGRRPRSDDGRRTPRFGPRMFSTDNSTAGSTGDDAGPEAGPERPRRGRRGGGHPGRPGRRGRGPADFGERGFGRGARVQRGDVRAALLALLVEQPMHGYQMIRELGERSNGAWRPSPGSVYPTLQQLQDEGLVTVSEDDGRRVFSLTEAGQEAAAVNAGAPAPWDVAAEADDLMNLRDQVRQVHAAVKQVAQVGDAAQLEAARVVLTDARRALYRILAEDSATNEGLTA